MASSFFTWCDEHEYWDKMLETEHLLADYFPRNSNDYPEPRPFKKRTRNALSQDVMNMVTEEYKTVQLLHGWHDQRKVASWALKQLEDGWHIHVLHDDKNVPLYYFILNVQDANNVTMQGLWRSIYGSLYYLSKEKEVVKGRAMELVKWAFLQHDISIDALVTVNAQLGLVKLFRRIGIELPFITPFDETVQGLAELTHFEMRNLYK